MELEATLCISSHTTRGTHPTMRRTTHATQIKAIESSNFDLKMSEFYFLVLFLVNLDEH